MTDDLLFGPRVTHVEVKCWDCSHTVTLKADDVPYEITGHQFEKRAVCRCGTGWPQVTKFPKRKVTSM